jgi:hypothetical protein
VTKEVFMITIRRFFRPVARLAAVASALLAGLVAAPAAFAMVPHPGPATLDHAIPALSHGAPPPVVRTVTVGGTAGWQIALLMAGAAAAAAIIAVLLYRMRSARRPALAAHTS